MKKLIAIAVSSAIALSANAATVTETVQQALSSHPDLQAARAGLSAAQSDIDVAKGTLRPRIDLNAGIGRERTDSDNVNGGDPISLTRRELGINATWALFDNNARGELARRMGLSEADGHALADLEQQIALQAASSYTNLWRAETLFNIARETREAHETLVDQLGRRVENGVSNQSELVQAQGRLALALSNQAAALSNLQDARANYHRVVGVMPDQGLVQPTFDWSRPSNLDAAVETAFNNHPVILEALADIEEAKGQAKSAGASNLPRVTLELGASRNEDLDGVRGVSKDRLAMLRLNWNLYNGGGNYAAKDAAGDRVDQAMHLLNDAQREVVEVTHQAWNSWLSSTQQLSYLDDYVLSADNTRQAYAQQFTINRRSLLEILDAEIELFDARTAEVNAQADRVVADFQLAASQGQLISLVSSEN